MMSCFVSEEIGAFVSGVIFKLSLNSLNSILKLSLNSLNSLTHSAMFELFLGNFMVVYG